MKVVRKSKTDFYLLFLIFALGLILKLPYLKQGLPPYLSCDEGFFANDVFRMIFEPSPFMKEFRSGAMNSWPLLPIGTLMYFGNLLSYTNLILVGRILLPIGLSALTIFPMYRVFVILGVSRLANFLTLLTFTISPFIVSQAEMWYPDAYITFVSALFILEFLKIRKSRDFSLRHNWKLVVLFSVGVSIKHNFAFFIVLILLDEISSTMGFNFTLKTFLSALKSSIRNRIKFVCTSIIVFFLINYSIFFDFLNFLRALNSNRKIYAVTDLNFLPGMVFYSYHLLVSPLGFIGLLLFSLGLSRLYRTDRQLCTSLSIFLILFLMIAGFPKQALSRNINLILPVAFIFFGIGISVLQSYKRKWVFASLLFILGASISRTEYDFQKNQLKPDSYKIAQEWVSHHLRGEIVGVNNGCNGPSPAFIGGASVRNVKDTSGSLKYYLFSSYGEGPFFNFFRQKNIFVSADPRYLTTYHFNDTRIFSGWTSGKTLESFVPRGYEIRKVFSGSGPTFVLLVKNANHS